VIKLVEGLRIDEEEIKLIEFVKRHVPAVFVAFTFADLDADGTVRDWALKFFRQRLPDIPVFVTAKNRAKPLDLRACPKCETEQIAWISKTYQWICTICLYRQSGQESFQDQVRPLVVASYDTFDDEDLQNAFAAAQQVAFQPKLNRSTALILAAVVASGGIGASPIPFSHGFLLIPLEIALVRSLAFVWNIPVSAKSLMKMGGFQICFSRLFASQVISTFGLIPGFMAVASATNSAFAAILTAGIGYMYNVAFIYAWQQQWTSDDMLSEERLQERLEGVLRVLFRALPNARASLSSEEMAKRAASLTVEMEQMHHENKND
jgi:uncharacterized protein (DUF697 family)